MTRTASRYRAAYFEQVPRHVGPWGLRSLDRARRHRDPRPVRCHPESRGSPDRHCRDLPAGRAVAAEVAEALAIGQEWDDDTRIVLFIRVTDPRLAEAGPESVPDALATRIRQRLRAECSPRHVPTRIIAVQDLPRTRSGKLAELAVADVVHGREIRNTEGLANPEVLQLFRDIAALRS